MAQQGNSLRNCIYSKKLSNANPGTDPQTDTQPAHSVQVQRDSV